MFPRMPIKLYVYRLTFWNSSFRSLAAGVVSMARYNRTQSFSTRFTCTSSLLALPFAQPERV